MNPWAWYQVVSPTLPILPYFRRSLTRKLRPSVAVVAFFGEPYNGAVVGNNLLPISNASCWIPTLPWEILCHMRYPAGNNWAMISPWKTECLKWHITCGIAYKMYTIKCHGNSHGIPWDLMGHPMGHPMGSIYPMAQSVGYHVSYGIAHGTAHEVIRGLPGTRWDIVMGHIMGYSRGHPWPISCGIPWDVLIYHTWQNYDRADPTVHSEFLLLRRFSMLTRAAMKVLYLFWAEKQNRNDGTR